MTTKMQFWCKAALWCLYVWAEAMVLLGLASKPTQEKVLGRIAAIMSVSDARRPRFVQELQRKTFHLQGIIGILLLSRLSSAFLQKAGWLFLIAGPAVACVELLRAKIPFIKRLYNKVFGAFLRPHEQEGLSGTCPLFLGLGVTLSSKDVVLMEFCMMVLFLGDAAASLFGVGFGKTKIFKNKSVIGFLTCFCVCTISSFYCFEDLAVWIKILQGFLCAFLELLCGTLIKIDDNLILPVGALVIGIYGRKLNRKLL